MHPVSTALIPQGPSPTVAYMSKNEQGTLSEQHGICIDYWFKLTNYLE
uniref:Uncharacterized protein n=1 Tax=Anguilla anguilla TaxID=7936 RepID=A0A0E9SZZ6_ANGAN